MGIEELERLVAEGIKAGLKGIELRRWVDRERAKLKAERQAKYEAEKETQEKENGMLRLQLAALEALKKRRAVEPAWVTDATAPHVKVAETPPASENPPYFPTEDLPVHASRGGFMSGIENQVKEQPNVEHVSLGQSRSEEETSIPRSSKTSAQTVEGDLPQSSLLLVDMPLPPKVKMKEAPAGVGAAITQPSDTMLSTVPNENGVSAIGLSDLHYRLLWRKPPLPLQASKKLQPEPKFKKMRFLAMGTGNRKALQTNRSHKLLRRQIYLPCLSEGRRLRFKLSNKTLGKIRSVWLPSQNWPRQVTFPTGQPIYLIHQTSQSYSRIHLTRTGHKDSKNWSVLQRLLYAEKDTRGHCVSKRSDWFSMRQRHLKLHGQHCWKYRKKS